MWGSFFVERANAVYHLLEGFLLGALLISFWWFATWLYRYVKSLILACSFWSLICVHVGRYGVFQYFRRFTNCKVTWKSLWSGVAKACLNEFKRITPKSSGPFAEHDINLSMIAVTTVLSMLLQSMAGAFFLLELQY